MIIRDANHGSVYYLVAVCATEPCTLNSLSLVILARGTEGRKRRAKCCPPWWLLFLCVFVGLALAQWSTVFKWATRECLNGEAGGVLECVCVCVCGGGWGEATRVCCDAWAPFLSLGGLSMGCVLEPSDCTLEYKSIFFSSQALFF